MTRRMIGGKRARRCQFGAYCSVSVCMPADSGVWLCAFVVSVWVGTETELSYLFVSNYEREVNSILNHQMLRFGYYLI